MADGMPRAAGTTFSPDLPLSVVPSGDGWAFAKVIVEDHRSKARVERLDAKGQTVDGGVTLDISATAPTLGGDGTNVLAIWRRVAFVESGIDLALVKPDISVTRSPITLKAAADPSAIVWTGREFAISAIGDDRKPGLLFVSADGLPHLTLPSRFLDDKTDSVPGELPLATSGNGFAMVYAKDKALWSATFDATGQPIAAPQLVPGSEGGSSPSVVWNGARYVVTIEKDQQVFESLLGDNVSRVLLKSASSPSSVMTDRGVVTAYVATTVCTGFTPRVFLHIPDRRRPAK